MVKLVRFWFEFEKNTDFLDSELKLGCGVSAYTKDDAHNLLKKKIFVDQEIPKITNIIENVDVNKLDEGHVVRRMGIVSNRGVWFPKHYI